MKNFLKYILKLSFIKNIYYGIVKLKKWIDILKKNSKS